MGQGPDPVPGPLLQIKVLLEHRHDHLFIYYLSLPIMAELSGHNRNHAGSKTEYIYCLAFAEKAANPSLHRL